MTTLPRTGSPNPITPCLWFDGVAEEAAAFYIGIFPNSRVTEVSRYSEAGQETHGQAPGTAMTVRFELNGQPFVGLNGGPHFKFNEAISFQVYCDDQAEIDHYWDHLSEGGDPEAQQCGWLKDRFGVSWQVVPSMLGEIMSGPDPEAAGRVTNAFMLMTKLDIAGLERAKAG